jgi:hypothetical protein
MPENKKKQPIPKLPEPAVFFCIFPLDVAIQVFLKHDQQHGWRKNIYAFIVPPLT